MSGTTESLLPTEQHDRQISTELSRVLFVGGVFPPDEEADIVAASKGPIQNAANALQWTLIAGFDTALRHPLTLLNAVFVGSYPKHFDRLWIRSRRWSHTPRALDRSIGFLNLFGVKHLWRSAALAIRACQWAVSTPRTASKTIVVYSLHTPFLIAAWAAKHLDRSIKVCVVVPDLPEFMNLGDRLDGFLRAMKVADQWLLAGLVKHMDSFVLLTRHMAGALALDQQPWMVMEGAVSPGDGAATATEVKVSSAEKVVLYTGTLHKAYGLPQLLDAFALLSDPTLRLWICGAGEAEAAVRAAATRDTRIHYLGQLHRADVLALQRAATVLVNPRDDSGEYTKYSFPSKVLEYMMSGTPAIVRKLPGIPEEYFPYLYVVEGSSATELAATIADVCNRPAAQLAEFGARAQRFVVEQKSGATQARRILDFIDSNASAGKSTGPRRR